MSDHDCNCGAHSGDPEHLTFCPMRGPRTPEAPVTTTTGDPGRWAVPPQSATTPPVTDPICSTPAFREAVEAAQVASRVEHPRRHPEDEMSEVACGLKWHQKHLGVCGPCVLAVGHPGEHRAVPVPPLPAGLDFVAAHNTVTSRVTRYAAIEAHLQAQHTAALEAQRERVIAFCGENARELPDINDTHFSYSARAVHQIVDAALDKAREEEREKVAPLVALVREYQAANAAFVEAVTAHGHPGVDLIKRCNAASDSLRAFDLGKLAREVQDLSHRARSE